jgi:hypothetical protein
MWNGTECPYYVAPSLIAGTSQTWHPQCLGQSGSHTGPCANWPPPLGSLGAWTSWSKPYRNVEEVNPSVIVCGFLRALALIERHHQGLLPTTSAQPTHQTAIITRCNQVSKGAIMPSSLGVAASRRHCTHVCTSTSVGSFATPVSSPCADNTPSMFLTRASSCSCTSSMKSLPPPKTPTKC